MKRTFPTLLTLAAAGVLACQTLPVHAQDDAPPPPPAEEGGGRPGGPGGPGGPEGDARRQEWRQRMADRIKTQMKATDDEWSVIQPLLEKVETKMRESMGRRFGGMAGGGRGGPRRGPGGDNNGGGNTDAANNRPQPAGAAETQALRTTLDGDASTNDIKAKLQAVRDQRKKSDAELASTREDLKKVLNLRQEAVLVLMGVLD